MTCSESKESFSKLGLIAGGGDIPFQVIEHCLKKGRALFGIGFKGQTSENLFNAQIPHEWFRLGEIGKILDALKRENVTEIVMIGNIKRPSFFELRPDLYTAKLLTRIGFKSLGDNELLSFLVQELEEQGFKIKGLQDVLPPHDVLLGTGFLGKHSFSKDLLDDIRRGIDVASLLGQADVGQSVIVDQGLVLGVEGIEVTDELIHRCGLLKKTHLMSESPSGVLVKWCKPQQEKRVDLPTLGLKTLENLERNHFLGVVAQAHNTLIVEPAMCTDFADQKNLFIYGWEKSK